MTGCLIAAFGFTWAILAQILHAVETRRCGEREKILRRRIDLAHI